MNECETNRDRALREAVERYFSGEATAADERLVYESQVERDVAEYLKRE